jgi:hypothetical protein
MCGVQDATGNRERLGCLPESWSEGNEFGLYEWRVLTKATTDSIVAYVVGGFESCVLCAEVEGHADEVASD